MERELQEEYEARKNIPTPPDSPPPICAHCNGTGRRYPQLSRALYELVGLVSIIVLLVAGARSLFR